MNKQCGSSASDSLMKSAPLVYQQLENVEGAVNRLADRILNLSDRLLPVSHLMAEQEKVCGNMTCTGIPLADRLDNLNSGVEDMIAVIESAISRLEI